MTDHISPARSFQERSLPTIRIPSLLQTRKPLTPHPIPLQQTRKHQYPSDSPSSINQKPRIPHPNMAPELLCPRSRGFYGYLGDRGNVGWEPGGSFCAAKSRIRGAASDYGRRPETARLAQRPDLYFREPRSGFRSLVCRVLCLLRLGLLIRNVPLPRYSALYTFSSAKICSPLIRI